MPPRLRPRSLGCFLLLLAIVAVGLGLTATADAATTCAGTLANTTVASLDVPAGSTCVLRGVTVSTAATVEGTLDASGGGASHFNGALTIDGGSAKILGGSISGALKIVNTPAGSFTDIEAGQGTGMMIGGTVTISGNAGMVRVANASTGSMLVSGNSGPIFLVGDHIGGPLSVKNNTGGVTLSGNAVSGSADCSGNSPQPSDVGVTNSISGSGLHQCSKTARPGDQHAVDHAYQVTENQTLTVPAPGVLAGSSDGAGAPLAAVLVDGPSHGTLVLNPDGSFTYTPAIGFHGTDSFTYTANDGLAASNTATATIQVNGPPVAVNDSYDVLQGGTLVVVAPGVLGNDSDPSGLPLSAVLGSGPSHGTLTLNSNGSFTYTPAAGFHGTDSFTYTAHDAFLGSNVATVTIHVRGPPVAVNDSYDVNKGATLSVAAPGVLANDSDPEGLPITAVLGTGPAHGTLTLNANGSFAYAPTAGFSGTDSFAYTAHDSFQGSNTATVTIHVRAPPVAVNDSYDVNTNATLTVAAPGVLGNDSDPEGLAMTALRGTGPSHGALTLNSNGSFTYTPTAGFNGTDSFTYTAHDSFQGSNTATVTIHVHAPPVAVNDSYDVLQGGTLVVVAPGVLGNDSDPGGLALSAVLGSGPSHGTLTLNSNGSFTYTPTAGFHGTDSFTYTAHDAFLGSNTATVTIHVRAPPVAVNDSYDVNKGAALNVAAPGVLGNDSDPEGLPITAVLGTGPAHGALTLNANGSFAYAPTAGFSGTDSFTYAAHDSFQGSNTATVTIRVHAPPVAVNDSYDVNKGATLAVGQATGVLANDSDPGGLPLSAVLGTGVAHGTLTLNGDGSFTYTPNAGFTGTDSFTYAAHDSFQGSNTATVTIRVRAPPVAVNDSYDVNKGATLNVAAPGVLGNDTDPEGLPITAVLGTGAAHGTLTLNASGSFTYTPTAGFSGTDSFTYTAHDSFQGSNAATVTIHVRAPPVAVSDSYDVNQNATLTVAAPGVLGNDSDPEGLAMTAVLGTGAAHGTLTLHADGSFTYVPTAGFSGVDGFTYTAHDSFQGSSAAMVTIRVHAPPVAVSDSYRVNKNTLLAVGQATGVLANDSDPGGLALTAVLGSGPSHGSLTLSGDGSFTYTPTTGFSGTDSLTYTAHDAFQGSNTATVTILVGAPPVAVDDSYDVNQAGTLTVAAPGVLGNDTDPNGLTMTAVLGTNVAHGSLTLNADGSFTYVPTAGFQGTDSFTYTAHDSLQGSNVATVTIAVHAPPVAVNDSYNASENKVLSVPVATGVLANDADPGGLALTAVVGAGPGHGSLTLNGDGSFTYSPTAGFVGMDSFTYTAHDSFQGSNVATVTITMHAPPVAVDDAYTVAQNGTLTVAAGAGVLVNDSDPGGLALTAVLGANVAHGSLALNSDGSFTYAPAAGFNGLANGTDSFTYTAHDVFGASNVATVTITVLAPPVAVDDTYGASVATAVSNNAVTALPRAGEHGVLFNDTDVNPFVLTVTQVGAGPGLTGASTLGATVVMNANGTFTYDPTSAPAGGTLKTLAVGATASDTFTYSISDGHGGSASATVHVLVTRPDSPPVAAPLAVNAVGNTLFEYGTQAVASSEPKTTAAGSLGSLVSDPDPGDSATVTAVDATSAQGGSVVFDSATGGFAYRAAAGFTGTDTFHYTATDTHGASTLGTVTVTVASKVWYVKNNASGANDGRSGSPFTTLAAAQSASGAGDTIFVFGGDGTSTGQSAGIVLKSSQRLIGQADVLTIGTTTLSAAAPASRPLLSASSGAVITLASAASVQGLAVNPSGTAAGISGDGSVNSATIDDVRISDSGSGEGVTLTASTGTIALTNSTVSSGTDDAVVVTEPSGSLNLTLTADTLTESNVSGNDALNITSTGSATVNPTISNTTINAARGDLFQLNIGDASSSTLSFTNNTLSNSNTNIVSGGGGVTITAGGGSSPHATLNFDIQHNTFRDSLGNAVGIGNATGANTISGTFSNNTIGVAAVANSGSSQGSDLSVAGVEGGGVAITIEHDNIYQYNNFGMTFQTTKTFSLDAKIDNNTIASPGNNAPGFFGSGIQLNAGTTTGDTNQVCFDAFANSLTGSGFGGGFDYKIRERQSTQVRLPGYAGTTTTQVAAFMAAQQTPNNPTTVATQVAAISGGAACNTP